MKLPLSACIISRNEEGNIRGCLESVAFCDELIVVDSGSDDATVETAKSCGAKVHTRAFAGYADQKNYAGSLAGNRWILSLDADERVSVELQKALAELLSGEPSHDGYRFPRRTWYIDKWIRHSGWYPDRQLRLYKKTKGQWRGESLHERVVVDGSVGEIRADILHYSFNSIRDHLQTIDNYSEIAAIHLHKAGKTRFLVAKLVTKPVLKFIGSYFLKRGFLDGTHGLVIASLSSYDICARYAKLYMLSRKSAGEGASTNPADHTV